MLQHPGLDLDNLCLTTIVWCLASFFLSLVVHFAQKWLHLVIFFNELFDHSVISVVNAEKVDERCCYRAQVVTISFVSVVMQVRDKHAKSEREQETFDGEHYRKQVFNFFSHDENVLLKEQVSEDLNDLGH